ncbi:MAG: hypothetical protein JWN48_4533 [Myxococcaceae bacterium]|nr:hypothetical protein [Myxococcaceae bacterium]
MVRARTEGPFTVDLDDFPLVLLRSPHAHEYEHIDVESFFACTDRAIARHRHFVLLHDARGMPYIDEARQSRFLDQLARRRRLIGKYVVAYAAVASSPLERGMITALGWSAHLPLPTRLFWAEPEARAFLLARHAGMPLRAGSRTPAKVTESYSS